MSKTELKQIYNKLQEIDTKVSALLVPEEKPSAEEIREIKEGAKEFQDGKFKSWKDVRSKLING